MILFVNFAPLAFGGGAENWLLAVSQDLSRSERVSIVTVGSVIANFYARLVLNRAFSQRVLLSVGDNISHTQINIQSLLPLTNQGKHLKAQFRAARIIYSKFELNEVLILWLFGGFGIFKKTIFGLHTPLLYNDSLTFWGMLHNTIYSSKLAMHILQSAKKVHVLSSNQFRQLKQKINAHKLITIPNFVVRRPPYLQRANRGKLEIMFVGELSHRKGADILIEIINQSPAHFSFTVAGDGVFQQRYERLTKQLPQLQYVGHLSAKKIAEELSQADVLILPSRAESFSLVILEALSHGAQVVCSAASTPADIATFVHVNQTGEVAEYIQLLSTLWKEKKVGDLRSRSKNIWQLVNQKFAKAAIITQLRDRLFFDEEEEKTE